MAGLIIFLVRSSSRLAIFDIVAHVARRRLAAWLRRTIARAQRRTAPSDLAAEPNRSLSVSPWRAGRGLMAFSGPTIAAPAIAGRSTTRCSTLPQPCPAPGSRSTSHDSKQRAALVDALEPASEFETVSIGAHQASPRGRAVVSIGTPSQSLPCASRFECRGGAGAVVADSLARRCPTTPPDCRRRRASSCAHSSAEPRLERRVAAFVTVELELERRGPGGRRRALTRLGEHRPPAPPIDAARRVDEPARRQLARSRTAPRRASPRSVRPRRRQSLGRRVRARSPDQPAPPLVRRRRRAARRAPAP